MSTISAKYADFSVRTRFEDLDQKIIDQAKMLILDLTGVSLAGYEMMEFPRLVVDYMIELGGKPEATILHTKRKFPAINAAFANAACAHALDMDDGHRFAALHPGTVIIPAAMAAAELVKASTREFIAGIVVGYEIMIRIGMAISPSSLNRGFHITGIAGSFGAAAAAANIMGLSHDETVGAFGMAGLQSSGLIQVNHETEGAKVKPINPARAAMSGILSCILAQRGAHGPENIFEGEDGFLKAVADKVEHDLLVRDLGQEFEICKVYLKLYAACRHAHACIDAALKANEDSGIDIEDIRKINVETYPAAVRLAGIVHPTTASAARFSIPFSVALALIRKDAGTDKYTEETVNDEKIQRLAGKVKLAATTEWQEVYPTKRGATLTIIDKNNAIWSARVDLAKGEPERPASSEEIHKKFIGNATQILSEKEAEILGSKIMKLEASFLDDIIRLL
ncbi:MAG: MmgE/PrpD family protein [Desulfatiglandaceae bacterium]|jgi:2-methylcitrate dehydratase PrpD